MKIKWFTSRLVENRYKSVLIPASRQTSAAKNELLIDEWKRDLAQRIPSAMNCNYGRYQDSQSSNENSKSQFPLGKWAGEKR